MKETAMEIEGVIHTVLPGTMFRMELENRHDKARSVWRLK
jgi:translation initiation factor IF-1